MSAGRDEKLSAHNPLHFCVIKYSLLIICFLTFFNISKSQVVSGIYKGNMEVDSPKNTINFELTLKQKKGKIYGYCYRLFIIGDTVYYNLVKVNAKITDGMLVVEDERSVSNNFEVSTKGIKTRFFFKLNDIQDTASVLPGEWQTSFWKNYQPLKGTITVIRENKYKNTQIYGRLTDLDLLTEMELEAPDVIVQKEALVNNNAPTKSIEKIENENAVAQTNKPSFASPATKTSEITKPVGIAAAAETISADSTISKPLEKIKTDNAVAQTDKPSIAAQTAKSYEITKPVGNAVAAEIITGDSTISRPIQKMKTDNAVTKTEKPSIATQTAKSSEISRTEGIQENRDTELQLQKNSDKSKDGTDLNVGNPLLGATGKTNISPSLVALQKRKSEAIQNQALLVYEDTVTLAIYDNGEIDGDTVSIFVNDAQIVSKIGLSARAYKINIPVYRDRINKVELFAENLGKIPPNTGLMVIYTGEQRYQVFFTATLEKNAVIYLERRE